jgi:Ca-activated chloride channel family protein
MCSPKKALEFSSTLRWLAVRLDRKFCAYLACVSFALAVFGLFSNFALAQTTPEGKSQQTAAPAQGLQQGTVPTFQAHADLVLIPVTVTDNLNRFVLGLQKQDFQLFEDGVEQNISLFSGEDAPLSVGMLFDKSASMAYKLGSSRDAATQLLTALNKEDEAFLVEFADIANLSVGLTAQTEEIRSALKSAKASGQTALLDAIETGLVEMKDAKNSRKAIVVISDGGDNRSHYTAAQIESLVREADVQIYVMGVFEPVFTSALTPEEISGPRLLSEIATQTGGRAFAASAPADMPSVATRIAVELRNQYVLGYYPKNKARNGRYRNVEVMISQPPGIGSLLKVHWRLGYYAPGQ